MSEKAVESREELLAVLRGITPTDQRLGEILVQEGKIERKELDAALEIQHGQPGRHLGEILVEMGFCSQRSINAALAHKLGIPFITLGNYPVDPAVLSLLPPTVAQRYSMLPLARQGNHLVVAMENPLDWKAMEVLRFNSNLNIEPVIAAAEDIRHVLDRYYTTSAEEDVLEEMQPPEQALKDDDSALLHAIAREAHKKPIVRLVNAILMQGITQHASDINIRPEKDRVDVYCRIDGYMQNARTFSRALLPPLVSRIKIMGQMNIAERRLPQDGHARVQHEGRSIDLRISIIPTVTGESVVIRILDKDAAVKPLDQLGFGESEQAALKRILSKNHGIFLLTGPTGSGKSTTLYAVLEEVRRRGQPHIITVEDPVEYDIPEVEQIQTLPAHGYTFAEALRHILRHDPDVVMIGEIRDLETARIAIKAALTGHLVFSTLHTNDASSVVTRLVDMGIEPYLLGSTLLGAMAQRLVRVNCPRCKAPEPFDKDIRRVLGVRDDEVFYRGTGCEACHQTGYRGRIAAIELLEMNEALSASITDRSSTAQIKAAAIEFGFTTLTQNALRLARNGTTSLEEVFAVRLE